jgi:hypothetical protein
MTFLMNFHMFELSIFPKYKTYQLSFEYMAKNSLSNSSRIMFHHTIQMKKYILIKIIKKSSIYFTNP